MLQQRCKLIVIALRDLRRVLGMDTCARIHGFVRLGNSDRRREVWRTSARADRQDLGNAGIDRSLDSRVSIITEAMIVEMRMRIRELHFKRAPGSMFSRKPASTGGPSGSDAATIMPRDSSPRSLRGARFATMITLRPTSCSG